MKIKHLIFIMEIPEIQTQVFNFSKVANRKEEIHSVFFLFFFFWVSSKILWIIYQQRQVHSFFFFLFTYTLTNQSRQLNELLIIQLLEQSCLSLSWINYSTNHKFHTAETYPMHSKKQLLIPERNIGNFFNCPKE